MVDIIYYKGKLGLERAQAKLRQYQKEHDCWPTSRRKDIRPIYRMIRKKEWAEYGIETWNDLLLDVFGEILSFSAASINVSFSMLRSCSRVSSLVIAFIRFSIS